MAGYVWSLWGKERTRARCRTFEQRIAVTLEELRGFLNVPKPRGAVGSFAD